jgi:hypothetical protein
MCNLTADELSLFYHMLNDRQLKAERVDEIPKDHPSSLYRVALLDKLRLEIIEARGT